MSLLLRKGWRAVKQALKARRHDRGIPKIGRGSIGLIDVGSIGGLSEPWSEHYELLSFLLNFEPNDAPKRRGNMLTYNTAVWEREETLPFYIYKGLGGTGSSLFRQNFEYVDAHWEELRKRGPQALAETWHDRSELVRTESLVCRSLDVVLEKELSGVPFHFLKIDAQGAEGNILRGADRFLATSCVGLHLELFTVPLYVGIQLKNEIVSYLDDRGFELVKQFPPHGTFDSQNDCLFLHRQRDLERRRLIRSVYGLG